MSTESTVLIHSGYCFVAVEAKVKKCNKTRGWGEGDSIAFHLRFLTHSACQCDVT